MLALAERLPKDRFDVDFVVLSGPGLYDERARAAGLRIRYAGDPPQAVSIPRRVWRRIAKTVRFIRLVRSGRYDVVDAWLYPADVLATMSRLVTRTPVVVTGRRNVDPQTAFGPLERVVTGLVARLTDASVANSQAAGDHAVQAGIVQPAKLRVIRNGVVIPPPATPETRAVRRSALGGGDDTGVMIGCVANFLPVKRHDLLLDAFATLVADVPAVRLILIGDGPLRPAIEAQIGRLGVVDRVRLLGSVREPEPLLAGLDIAVQASDREGLPNALLEAGAAGLPMVATDAGGSAEIVRDGITGFLVPRNDPHAMTAALRRLAVDPDLRRSMGEAAREHTAARFGMDRFVAEFAALYESLVQARRRG